MIPLTEEQIRYLLEMLSFETLWLEEPRGGPSIRLQRTRRTPGYADDPLVGRIQAALSVGLQAYARREELEAEDA